MGVSKTIDQMQIKIKMPNLSQKPLASSKAQILDLRALDVLCTLKIRIEWKTWNMGVSKTSDHIKIKIKMPQPSQEPLASPKSQNEDLKDMDVLCTFKFKI